METKIKNMIDATNGIVEIPSALQSKWSGTQWVLNGDDYDGLKWKDGQEKEKPTKSEVEQEVIRLQVEYDSKKYQRDRALAYDPIPEQLDQIYHDMDGWKAKIKSVKDKYPKP